MCVVLAEGTRRHAKKIEDLFDLVGRHRPQKFRRVGQTTPPGTPCLALVFAGEMRAPRRTRRGLAGRGVVEVAGRGWKERTTTHHETAITRNSTWLLLLLQSRTPPPTRARTHSRTR